MPVEPVTSTPYPILRNFEPANGYESCQVTDSRSCRRGAGEAPRRWPELLFSPSSCCTARAVRFTARHEEETNADTRFLVQLLLEAPVRQPLTLRMPRRRETEHD